MDEIFKIAKDVNDQMEIPDNKKGDPSEIFKALLKKMPEVLENSNSPLFSGIKSEDIDQSITIMQQVFSIPGGDVNQAQSQVQVQPQAPSQIQNVKFEEQDVEEDVEDNPDEIKPKTDDLHHTINVKLSHLYTGKKKKIAFKRNTYKKENGKIVQFEEKKQLVIPIVPGTKHGDTFKFEGQADNYPNHTPGDVIIEICEIPDDVFIRDDDNLLVVMDLSLSDNYCLKQSITHLDGRVIHFTSPVGEAIIKSEEEDGEAVNDEDNDEIDTTENTIDESNGIRKIKGEGMPIKGTDRRGDLYFRFNLKIPESLSKENALKLREIIPISKSVELKEDDKEVLLERLDDDDEYLNNYEYFTDDDDEDDDAESEADESEEEDSESESERGESVKESVKESAKEASAEEKVE